MGDGNPLKTGVSIRILRSDGRVQSATISKVNYDSQTVTVEWFENDEVRGKEIEFDIVFDLNADLFPTENQAEPIVADAKTKLTRRNKSLNENRPALPPTRSRMSCDTKCKMPKKSTNDKPLTQGLENVPSSPVSRISLLRGSANNKRPLASTISEASIAARPRRSNVVKEVEKMKKNREERRIRQAEMKEEKEAMMDRGNPNWQFLAMIKEYQATLEFQPLKETDQVENHQITVCVRKRPLNKKEISRKEIDVISVPRKDLIIVHEPKSKVDLTKYLENQQYRFDYAFDETCDNETVYKYTAQPLVKTIFEGGTATCFAYGQTGSGKTHTMGGTVTGKTQDAKRGIYAMVAKDVFNLLRSDQYKSRRLMVASSFFEIYSGKVFDLLADKSKLRVLEDGRQQVQVVGLTERVVNSVEGVLSLIETGNKARTSGQTSANSNSSRSHAVFQITLRTDSYKVFGKFSLIDLAGNERGVDTSSADRITRMEGAEINKSLLALKECIRALGRKDAHLPFRTSVLTQVLRDSFIGDNTKTCMIAMISPGMGSCDHSLNTLRYADRVKELGATEVPTSTSEETSAQTQTDSVTSSKDVPDENISQDLLRFHSKALSDLQKSEDDMLEGFRLWRDKSRHWDTKESLLFNMTRQFDYDVDQFSANLLSVLKERLDCSQKLLGKVKTFREHLDSEDAMAKQILNGKGQNVNRI